MSISTGAGVLGAGVSHSQTQTADLSEWRIVFDGAQIWLGREDKDGSTVDKLRLRPVLRVREMPVPVQGKPGVFTMTMVGDSVLNRLPALPHIDVARDRTSIRVTDFADDSFWVNFINDTLLQFRARNAGLTV